MVRRPTPTTPARAVRGLRLLTLVVLAALIVAAIPALMPGKSFAGAPLYPDLRTAQPRGFWLDTEVLDGGKKHYLVRFDNRVENWGGPLVITSSGNAGNKRLYQHVYDTYSGNNEVRKLEMGGDFVYHPQHAHFHITDFAQYILLKKNDSGVYVPTTKRGEKTTFCVMDTTKVPFDGPQLERRFDTCGSTVQGMSSGWGDTYTSDLYGQWISNGTSAFPDGDYAIQSTADPLNRVKETNDRNNTNLGFFNIRNGKLSHVSVTRFCTQKVANPVQVGGTTEVFCNGLRTNSTYTLRWGSQSGQQLGTATTGGDGKLVAKITVPSAPMGVNFVFVTRSGDAAIQAPITIAPSIAVSPANTKVGTAITVTLRGYGAGENVDIVLKRPESTNATLGTVKVGSNGAGEAKVTVAQAALGEHAVIGVGQASGGRAESSVNVGPTVSISPRNFSAGTNVQINLRGFASGENVKIYRGTTLWKTITVSRVGSAGPDGATAVSISASVAPGTYQVKAVGQKSGVSAQTSITVSNPTATPTTVPATATSVPSTTVPPTATTSAPSPTTESTSLSPTPTEAAPTAEPTATTEPSQEPTPTP